MIAIRREDQSVWERRAPFAPQHVKRLVRKGVTVLVQPSNRRAYPMQVKPEIVIKNHIADLFITQGKQHLPALFCKIYSNYQLKAVKKNLPCHIIKGSISHFRMATEFLIQKKFK